METADPTLVGVDPSNMTEDQLEQRNELLKGITNVTNQNSA